jgi:hypothetical protein
LEVFELPAFELGGVPPAPDVVLAGGDAVTVAVV